MTAAMLVLEPIFEADLPSELYAVAGWDLHPLESAAFSRRTQRAVVPRLRGGQVKSTRSGRSFFVTALARVDRLRQEPFAQGRH